MYDIPIGVYLGMVILVTDGCQDSGEPQYCSNNATTPEASCLSFYQPGCSYKLGSDGAICTSTSSCRSCHLVSWHKSARAQANFYRLTEEALSMMDES